uniref:Uncharacterized protein n=1 Tax=Rhizophora mucronata TaxID=61149 RepID=A0A2P2L208_RHIMU
MYLLFGSMDRAFLISSSAFSNSDVLRYACARLNKALTFNGSISKACHEYNIVKLTISSRPKLSDLNSC